MSNVKISQLPAATQVNDTDVFPVDQGNTTRKVRIDQLPMPSTDWPDITNKPSVFPPDLSSVTPASIGAQPAGNYATLVNGEVPASQLPSYVDDIIEVANFNALPVVGESGKIYVTANNNKVYRWAGTTYVEIVASPQSTDAVPEGVINLYFTPQRASDAAPVQSVAGRDGDVVLTKTDVGLANVDNTSDANKPISNATQNALDGKVDIRTQQNIQLTAVDLSLNPARNKQITLFGSSDIAEQNVSLPFANNIEGDTLQIVRGVIGSARIYIRYNNVIFADLGTDAHAGRSFTFRWQDGNWVVVQVDAHSADKIVAGTLSYERIPVGSTSNTVAAGNDLRLSNARQPTAHASTHTPSGTDPLALPYSSLTDIPASFVPSAHASSHAVNGADQITPLSINAQDRQTTKLYQVYSNGNVSLTNARNEIATISIAPVNLTVGLILPRVIIDGAVDGDILELVLNVSNRSTVTLYQYQWTGGGGNYTGVLVPLGVYTKSLILRLRLNGGTWQFAPLQDHSHPEYFPTPPSIGDAGVSTTYPPLVSNAATVGAQMTLASRHVLYVPLILFRTYVFTGMILRTGGTQILSDIPIAISLYSSPTGNWNGQQRSNDQYTFPLSTSPNTSVPITFASPITMNAGLIWVGIGNLGTDTLYLGTASGTIPYSMLNIVGSNTGLTGSEIRSLTTSLSISATQLASILLDIGRTLEVRVTSPSQTTLRCRTDAFAVWMTT